MHLGGGGGLNKGYVYVKVWSQLKLLRACLKASALTGYVRDAQPQVNKTPP